MAADPVVLGLYSTEVRPYPLTRPRGSSPAEASSVGA